MRATSVAEAETDRANGGAAARVQNPAADAELTTEEQVERACADLRAAVEEFHHTLAEFEGVLRK